MLLTRLGIALLPVFVSGLNLQSPPEPQAINPANTIESPFASKDWELTADPQSSEWANVPGVQASRDQFGEPLSLSATEVRSRWTKKHLYLLFICPYRHLNLKPDPITDKETDKLWKWDVVEAFIGSDYLNQSKYKEFQASPQGEYVDLDIDREHSKEQKGVEWDSGMAVKGRIDAAKKMWYAEMQIPFAALDVKLPKVGGELRIGLFRIAGSGTKRTYVSWRATGATTFHVPEAFGSLVLAKEPAKEPVKEPAKEPGKEPAKDVAKEPVKEIAKEPAKPLEKR